MGATGDQGFGLALRWAKAGENVIIGSRQATKAGDAAKRGSTILTRDGALKGMENPAAVAASNVIVLTVPYSAQAEIITSVSSSLKEGDIFVSVTVPLSTGVGGKATGTLDVREGSAAEQAREMLPKFVEVVSAFNNVGSEMLQDIQRPIDCDIILCGDSAEAKSVVKELANKIPGGRAIDGGRLENARITEQITALLIGFNIRYKAKSSGIRITGISLQ